jgi:hypothetical protein
MAFKLTNPPYTLDGPSVYLTRFDEDPSVIGRTNKNGTILINENLDPKYHDKVIKHEKVHVDQIERGDLDWDGSNFYWKGERYHRSLNMMGTGKEPWEKEAYKKGGVPIGKIPV